MIQEKEIKQTGHWAVYLDPFFKPQDQKRGFHARVDVHSDIEFGSDTWAPAEVGWYSIGSVQLAEADIFAKAIQRAVEIGKAMDKEHGIA